MTRLHYAFAVSAFRPWWKFWTKHTIVSHRFDEDFFWTGFSANVRGRVLADFKIGRTMICHLVLEDYPEPLPLFSGWQINRGSEMEIDFKWLGTARAAQIVFYGTVSRPEPEENQQ